MKVNARAYSPHIAKHLCGAKGLLFHSSAKFFEFFSSLLKRQAELYRSTRSGFYLLEHLAAYRGHYMRIYFTEFQTVRIQDL